EYEESEETTFSYPAKILPPSPQNIAKSIIIIPENFDINNNGIDISLIGFNSSHNPYDNTNEWFNNNKIKTNDFILNLTSKLDPTLLIYNFNDLKRYYKSLTIYYKYNFETIENKHNEQAINFNTTESFNPSKEAKNTSITIDLKDLIFSNSQEKNVKDWKLVPNVQPYSAFGYAYNSKLLSNYNLAGYTFTLTESYYGIKEELTTDSACGINILNISSNNTLIWKFNIYVNLGKIESIYGDAVGQKVGYAKRYISSSNLKITKLILNNR
ncbi:MAG: hypothetical protein H9Q67_06170, partial [Spiroplasma ixodetis]|nr:hypothetical protein [Spiroplasma ixodetis]